MAYLDDLIRKFEEQITILDEEVAKKKAERDLLTKALKALKKK